MSNGEMPDIEKVTSDSDDAISAKEITAILTRRFAWDVMPCPEVNGLLTALGMVHGSEEGELMDHTASHQRMALAYPLELLLQAYSSVLGTVVSTAYTEAAGVTSSMGDDASIVFAEQNAEVVLAGARAIIASLLDNGILDYGPSSGLLAGGESVV